MNMKRLAYKLQTALIAKGRVVRINQMQVYMEDKGRMATKYALSERKTLEDGKVKYLYIFESYQIAEVVKTLAGMLGAAGGA